MRRKIIMGSAIAASLVFAGTASAQPVQSLTGDWSASNSTVHKTADGVHFGIYANGGTNGGSVIYRGANGTRLSDVTDFSYTANYRDMGGTKGAAPYARIFLDNNGDGVADGDVLLDPSLCNTVTPDQGVDRTYQMVGKSVRYNDDACDGAPLPGQQDWDDVVNDHGNETITMIAVTQGFSMGTDVSAMLKSVTFNGESFDFNVAPRDGTSGENGTNGTNGTNGVDGKNDASGTDGKEGVTTIVHQYGTGSQMLGASMRTLPAPLPKGAKLVSVKAP